MHAQLLLLSLCHPSKMAWSPICISHDGNAGKGFLKWARCLLVTAVTKNLIQYAINSGFWTVCTAAVPSDSRTNQSVKAGNTNFHA